MAPTKNRAAYITAAKASPFKVDDAPYPTPLPHEIVIKSGAVAVNPVDWKMQYLAIFDIKYPHILGEDVAGEVVEVGNAVKNMKVGDRVCGYAQGISTGDLRNDTFQTYVALPEIFAFNIPDHIDYAQASVLPLGMATAAAGLYSDTHLNLAPPKPSGSVSSSSINKIILIWGGASSVGSCAIQLSRASGVQVAAVASAANHDYCQKLGANFVFDYKSPNVVDEIVSILKGHDLVGAFDAVGDEATQKACVAILSKVGGSQTVPKVATINPGQNDTIDGVNIVGLFAQQIGDNNVAHAIFGEFLPKAVASGSILPKPDPLVVAEGLEGIQAGVDACRKGTSARKIVVKL